MHDKLNLPVFKEPLPEPRSISMDDYLKFVGFNLRYIVDIEAVRNWKKELSVNVPFRLK